MNWNDIQREWDVLKDRAAGRWVQLTDQDLDKIGGDRDELVACLTKRYGERARTELEREVDDWGRTIDLAATPERYGRQREKVDERELRKEDDPPRQPEVHRG